jgi:hypothetical protein
MGFPSSAVRFRGESLKFTSKAASGGDAVRNSCPVCGSLVFGGEVGKDQMFTIYAGSLDDPSLQDLNDFLDYLRTKGFLRLQSRRKMRSLRRGTVGMNRRSPPNYQAVT